MGKNQSTPTSPCSSNPVLVHSQSSPSYQLPGLWQFERGQVQSCKSINGHVQISPAYSKMGRAIMNQTNGQGVTCDSGTEMLKS